MNLYLIRVPIQTVDEALFIPHQNSDGVVGIEKGRCSTGTQYADVLSSESEVTSLSEDELLEWVFRYDKSIVL